MKLRGAMIGCGYFAQHHLEAWKRISEVEIVAACDLEYDRARRFADRAYCSAGEMLSKEQLDFVDIVTRVESHVALVALAAQSGIAIICQKPIAPDGSAALQLVETVERAGVPFMVHENWRWQPWYRVASEMIRRGDIGQPIGYGFRTRACDGVGGQPYPRQSYMRGLRRFLIDEALVHHFDTARFLFGDICSIFANTGKLNPQIAGEDRAIVIANHRDGVSGWVDGHRFLNPNPDGPAMGEALLEGDGGVLLILGTGDVYRDNVLTWKNTVSAGYRGDSVHATQAHFVRALVEKREFETGARDYLKTFAAVEAAYQSAESHRLVYLTEMTGAGYSPSPSASR